MIKFDVYDDMVVPDKITQDAIRKLRQMVWKPKFSIRKRTCYLSGETIGWFTNAYLGTKIIKGPGTDVVITKWATEEAVMFEKLRGRIK